MGMSGVVLGEAVVWCSRRLGSGSTCLAGLAILETLIKTVELEKQAIV